jgi:hypothetical protein
MDPPYDHATLMDIGGTLVLPTPGSYVGTALATLTTVTADGRVTNGRAGDLNTGRWYSSAVSLPTGEVLAVSGADRDATLTPGFEIPVRQPELYDPETATWTPMATAARDRTYHNSAVLLPDGRVLVGGHAPFPTGAPPLTGTHRDVIPGVTADNERDPSFEVFSPPYLFRGPRPRITRVPRGVTWGETFRVASPDAASISDVVLSRLPSPQHVIDPDARTLRLQFSAGPRGVTAVAPPASSPGTSIVAPPGYYYLFIIKDSPAGPIPSVARIIKLGPSSDRAPAPPIYSSDDLPAPDTSGGATEPADTSPLGQLPQPPLGATPTTALAGQGQARRRSTSRCGPRGRGGGRARDGGRRRGPAPAGALASR